MLPELVRTCIFQQSPLFLALQTLSVVALAVILDRLLFWVSTALHYRPLPPEIYQPAQTAHRRQALFPSTTRRQHYLSHIARSCVQVNTTDEQVEQTVTEQLVDMNARLGLLDLIAKIAPLVGILGTVVGMATSFGGVAGMTSASPSAISKGISVALQTTAYGLVISIAATVASVGFRRLTDRAALKIGRVICEIQQHNKAHNAWNNGECECESSGQCGSDPHARHHLSDHPAAAGDADAQLHCAGFSSELPDLC